MARGQQPAQPQQVSEPSPDGLPPGLRLYTPFPFNGMNAKGSPTAIEDDEFVVLENVMWIGHGQLAFLYSNDTSSLYTATGGLTITTYYFYVLGGIQYVIVFLSDGGAIQVQVSNLATTTVAATGTFTLTPTAPVVAPWAGQFLLIGTTNSYYAWDGAILYKPGTLSPQIVITSSGNGSYTSAPTITISGGSGTGAAATATIDSNGYVTKVVLTNPGSGYVAADVNLLKATFTGGGITNKLAQGTATIGAAGVTAIFVLDGGTGYTNQPAITITGGGGSTQATATAAGTAQSITTITVVTPGAGYTSNPAVAVGAPAAGGNTATAVAVIGYNGISAVTVTDAGDGYTTTPTVVITDPTGAGSGATGVALMSGATVASVTIRNPGQNYKQATVSFVGGNPAVASATLSLMPIGGTNPISATSIVVFKSRVWMVNNTYQFVSAPSTLWDFAATDGGLITQITDSYLSYQLFGLEQSGGFLYQFGDSSIDSISNPTATVSSGIVTTTYTRTNADPQVGCPWPLTIQPFGQGLIFANPNGIYALYGSRVEKISAKLDDYFNGLPTQPQNPSAAITLLFGIKCYVISLYVTDQLTGVNRQLIFGWDGFRWFQATQVAAITGLRTVTFARNQIISYGTDGTHIYQCFTLPSASLTKKIVSKFYGAESLLQYKQCTRFYVSADKALTYDIVLHMETGDNDLGNLAYPGAPGPASNNGYGGRLTVQGQDAKGLYGRYVGWTLSSTTTTCNISYMGLAYAYFSGYHS